MHNYMYMYAQNGIHENLTLSYLDFLSSVQVHVFVFLILLLFLDFRDILMALL